MGCYVSTPIESDESKRYMFTGEEPELEVNDEQIIKTWWKKMGEEHFRYGLEETKVVMINKYSEAKKQQIKSGLPGCKL